MSTTSLAFEASRSRMPVVLAFIASLPVFGLQVGTGGAATVEYLKTRGSRGYAFVASDPLHEHAGTARVATPAENLQRIRTVLQPNVTDLARSLGVSRQAIYDWQAGRPISAENVARIGALARAADVFAREGLQATAQVMRRPISGGKNFLEVVRSGGSPEVAAQELIEIVRRELLQRERRKARLSARPRPTREEFSDLGAPALDENG